MLAGDNDRRRGEPLGGTLERMPVSIRPPQASTIAVPKTTATKVAMKPLLRKRRVRTASRIIGRPPGYGGLTGSACGAGAEVGEPVGDLLGGRREQAAGEHAVGEEDHLVGVRGGDRVVGHHHDGLALAADRLAEQFEDVGGGLGVQRAGRLVGEDHRGPRDQGAGDGDALLLAAGQFARAALVLAAEADAVEDLADGGPVRAAPVELLRQRDVLPDRQRGQQVERLEDEADPLPAQLGELPLVQAGQRLVVDDDGAGRRPVESGGAVQEGALAGARTGPSPR